MDAGGREFRFRGDLYCQESTFPLVRAVIGVAERTNSSAIAHRCRQVTELSSSSIPWRPLPRERSRLPPLSRDYPRALMSVKRRGAAAAAETPNTSSTYPPLTNVRSLSRAVPRRLRSFQALFV